MKTKHIIMKKIKIITATAALAILFSASFSSCTKKDKTEKDTDTSEAQDHTLAETSSNDVVTMASQASETGNTSSYRLGSSNNNVFSLGCTTVYRDTIRLVDSLVFNGACLDGKSRSGSLTFTYASNSAKHYRNPGFSCSVKSYNYVVNGNQIDIISKTITNTTPANFNPATTNLTWNISANISVVKASNGGTHSATFTRTKTLLNTSDASVYSGQANPINWNLASIGITGSASGVTAKGRSYTSTITNQLVRNMTCSPDANHPGHHPYVQGTIDFTPSGKAQRIIDYGNGNCDLDATVTIDGVSHTITLP